MKLPQMTSKNKIRDYKICREYVYENRPVTDIASTYGISTSRVYIILYRNRTLVSADKHWEKTKRIHKLKRWIGTRKSTKDPADLLNQIRVEIEGDNKFNLDQSQHTHYQFEYKQLNEDNIRASQSSNERMDIKGEVEGTGSGKKVREDATGRSRIDEEGTLPPKG